MDKISEAFSTIKDKTINATSSVVEILRSTASSVYDKSTSTASSVYDKSSSTASVGVDSFKGTTLGESFFKNISAIIVVVFILLGGIIYIDFAKAEMGGGGDSSEQTVHKTISIEPNTVMMAPSSSAATGGGRIIPTNQAWTAPLVSIQNELREGFGSDYSEKELETIHTKCSDNFCVMNNKSPEELEKACNGISSQLMCGTKCCCGWTKFIGHDGDTDPIVVANKLAAANNPSDADQKDGKCVSGNSRTPLNYRDDKSRERDIEYYYYMGKCTGGRGCGGGIATTSNLRT